MAENIKESENLSEKLAEGAQWQKQDHLGIADKITPLLNCLLVVLEEERKQTLKKIEEAKKFLDKMKSA